MAFWRRGDEVKGNPKKRLTKKGGNKGEIEMGGEWERERERERERI